MINIFTRVATCLASDHLAVSFPDVDTPFADAADVVRRLLPYHVFQHPADDLKIVIKDPSGKGKAKATGEDLLRQEIAGMKLFSLDRNFSYVGLETKFALECFKRRKALEDRFRKAKAKSAEVAQFNSSPIAFSHPNLARMPRWPGIHHRASRPRSRSCRKRVYERPTPRSSNRTR